jgi:peptidoglycan hydrolase-like protein with peptidoglycan-binding domain
MSGSPRDLAAVDPWEASLARSRARRERAAGRSPMRLANMMDARRRLPSPRNLAEEEPWELSTLRSRTRRKAAELQFVPTATRARRVSLGTLIALAAGPAAGLADANGVAQSSAGPPAPEPPTTTEHHVLLENGSEGRQVRLLQEKLGIVADGVFGPETEAAVRSFQAAHGLEVDGIVGPRTSAALAGEAASVTALADTAETAFSSSVREAVSYPTSSAPSATAETHAKTAAATAGTTTNPVVRLQEALGVQVDGTFGPETERAVRHAQALHHLHVDGVVGGETWSALRIKEHAVLHPVKPRAHVAHVEHHASAHAATEPTSHSEAAPSAPTSRADAVRRLQEALHVQADGAFGPETEAAVKHMQAARGIAVDGVVGPETWSALGIDEHATLHPPHAVSHDAGEGSGGSSSDSAGGGGSSSVLERVIGAADEIATRPYVYGGGHGSFESTGYDCSGSVSYALHGGGLLSSPEDSSALESYGEAGPGRYITIYANAEHAWMVIDGRRFDTVAQQETGTRWSDSMTSTAGYVVRHPAGY